MPAGLTPAGVYFTHSNAQLACPRGRATGTYWAIFGVVFSTLFVPLPEELALLGAGYLAPPRNHVKPLDELLTEIERRLIETALTKARDYATATVK